MRQGYLAMVLHAHLPFVRHAKEQNALEERWLFEALSETYLPLLAVWERLRAQEVPFAFALTLSPTLLTLLTDSEMAERFVRHLKKTIELTERELVRTCHQPDVHRLARMYRGHFAGLLCQFERYQRNIVPALVSLSDSGHLELLTCGATHGFLPALGTKEAQEAQIAVAVETHMQITGRQPRGIWLPECGYVPGIEQVLEQQGLRYFLVDSHAFDDGEPGAQERVYAPRLVGTSQVYALARDGESARQVWSSFTGYPGDPDYREYYRDIGFDLDWAYIKDYVHPDGIRVNTGIKYHRVTGPHAEKGWYIPLEAAMKCKAHAAHFVQSRAQRMQKLWAAQDDAAMRGANPPLIVAPYDAELFGHWWYEGPQWIEQVAMALSVQDDVRLITPSAYLEQFAGQEQVEMGMSSWGRGGYGDVWINEANEWMYPHLHRVEEKLVALIRRKRREGLDERTERALLQLAREVLLAESSDWAFIMTMGTTVQYAKRRTLAHLQQAMALSVAIEAGAIPDSYVQALAAESPIFPGLTLDHFVKKEAGSAPLMRVLMLSWEFPPRTVGGLARHVYDLSRALSEAGVDVHVVTCHGEGTTEYERVDGVHVHRVEAPHFEQGDFVQWATLLNIRLAALGQRVVAAHGPFDVVHAHDWLVAESAYLVTEQAGCPLVSTIHATEYGRNRGLYSDLQQRIAQIERRLAERSQEVIVCSQYMRAELTDVYGVPVEKQHVLPNGVDLQELQRGLEEEVAGADESQTVFYVGRLVPEKGVQVLLEAAPRVFAACPAARIVIAGKGPMLERLQAQANELGISERVDFLGFVTDEERNRLMQKAAVAVFPSLYEPFGIVALEAMGSGTATVVTRTGGLAEIIESGVDGWLVEPGDARQLGDTLIHVLQQQEARQQVALRGQRKAAVQYGWSHVAQGTLEVYQLAVKRAVSESGAQPERAADREKHPIRL